MNTCADTVGETARCGCYQVQALVTVDERGQMVLPKNVRVRAGIQPRDKLALTTLEKDGKICCILLTKADELASVIQSTIGTLAADPVSGT